VRYESIGASKHEGVGKENIVTAPADQPPHPEIANQVLPPGYGVSASVKAIGLLVVLRAFANGCSAMTGTEAISNGIGAVAMSKIRAKHYSALRNNTAQRARLCLYTRRIIMDYSLPQV
jgi:hypothetical protein